MFGSISLSQIIFIDLGCLFFLQIDVVHPVLFLIVSCLISFCYSLLLRESRGFSYAFKGLFLRKSRGFIYVFKGLFLRESREFSYAFKGLF